MRWIVILWMAILGLAWGNGVASAATPRRVLLRHKPAASAPAPKVRPYWELFQQHCGDRALKRWAQAKVESGLNPTARSPVGAQGLTQFMPRTWQRAIKVGWVPEGASPLDPEMAVRACDGYMLWEEGYFHDLKGPQEIQRAAWSGYNAGEGNIRRAINRAKGIGLQGPDAWMRVLPGFTHEHSAETLAYYVRIEAVITKESKL